MDAKQFLETIVPWQDYVGIHWHRPETKGFFGRSCRTIDEAMKVVADIAARADYNLYFCISSQKLNNGRRKAQYATGFVCLPMDLDVKKNSPDHYGTIAEALAALFTFCDDLGIPRPGLIVFTGGGIHAYWLSKQVLTPEDWKPYAMALKAAALSAGLKFDAQCTGDAARVLRVPGTTNWKYDPPPVVRVSKYGTGDKLDFATAFKPIEGLVPKGGGPRKPRVKRPDIVIADAFKGIKNAPVDIKVEEHPPLPWGPILNECGWLREAFETGGKGYDNDQWNLTTLIATFLKDGHELAHRFADKYPDYSVEETDDLWERKNRERRASNLGWPLCSTIETKNNKHCPSCPHRGKIKSPVSIGHNAWKNPVDAELEELGGTRPPEFRLPDGYCLNEEGQIAAIAHIKKTTYLHRLFRTVIRPPVLQHQDDCFGIGFTAETDRGGTVEVFISAKHCYGGAGDFLAGKCVLTVNDKGTKSMVEVFADAWLDKLLKSDVAVRDTGTMGWRYNNTERVGFVFGNTLYCEDGTEVQMMTSADSNFRRHYVPVGTRDAWLAACKLLTDRKRPELNIIIAIGFAAPLMTFAGTLYGAIVSIWGDPGTSKSTAQMVAAALWGHPKQTRESLNSTPKSVQGRLGRCRNLAAFWDDVQDEKHQDALFNTMFVATQGTEGGRLNQDASMKDRLDWQTLLVVCANASFVEYLTKKQKSTTAGMRRVFEIEFQKRSDEPGIIDATEAGRVFAALERNYGVVGVEYAKILATEHKTIDQIVADTMKAFCASVEGTPDEAYWWGCCAVLLVGATLAKRLGVDIDVDAMQEFLQRMFRYNRMIRLVEGTEGGSYAHTEHALVSFLNFFVGQGFVYIGLKLYNHKDRGGRKPNGGVDPVRSPDPGHRIVVQVAREPRLVIFSKKEFRDYMQERNIQTRQVFHGIEVFFGAKEIRHTMGAGTKFTQGQETCYEIFVSDDKPSVLTDLVKS